MLVAEGERAAARGAAADADQGAAGVTGVGGSPVAGDLAGGAGVGQRDAGCPGRGAGDAVQGIPGVGGAGVGDLLPVRVGGVGADGAAGAGLGGEVAVGCVGVGVAVAAGDQLVPGIIGVGGAAAAGEVPVVVVPVAGRAGRAAGGVSCPGGERPPLIPFNPAVRPRNRGRKTGRRLDRAPQRAWASPLEVLLTAERAALLTGRDDEFTLLVAIGYTGMRWGETTGLEDNLIMSTLINVEWQLHEINGRFYRLPPKDDAYRSTNWDPFVPVDIPDFLAALLTAQADKHARLRCACFGDHGGTGRYLFYSPEGGHYRRSNFARRVFRPACDGRYPSAKGSPGRLVVTDASAWPGRPVASWPSAMPGRPFVPPAGRGTERLVNTNWRIDAFSGARLHLVHHRRPGCVARIMPAAAASAPRLQGARITSHG